MYSSSQKKIIVNHLLWIHLPQKLEERKDKHISLETVPQSNTSSKLSNINQTSGKIVTEEYGQIDTPITYSTIIHITLM